MHEQLNNYLSGKRDTGVLLCGKAGIPLLEDAMSAASAILGVTQDGLNTHPDFLLINKDGCIGVEDVYEIISRSTIKPSLSEKIVVVINKMETVTEQAQNKLLKLIEENSTTLIFATCNDESGVLPTIKSRMRSIRYIPISYKDWLAEEMKKGIDAVTASINYYVSNGCATSCSICNDVVEVFKKVHQSFVSNNPADILIALGQVKEKDKMNYAEMHADYTSNLYSFLSALCMECLFPDTGKRILLSKAAPSYSADALIKAIEILNVTNKRQVTKVDLFYDMTKFAFCLMS